MENHIQIHGVSPRIQYVANGQNTVFEFPFAIFKNENLQVYFNDVLQSENSYSISGAGDSEGGSVTFSSAPASGTIVTLFRNLSIERTTDFQEGGALRANALNYELDYQIACQQQIADNMNRVMCMPPYAVDTNIDLTLPTPSAGKAIVWNSDGTNLENSTVEVNALESTLNGYKNAAASSAQTATQKASVATQKAAEAASSAERINLEAKMTNCILRAPNGICSYSGSTITAPRGLSVLIPSGRENDGSLKNFTVTLNEAKTVSARFDDTNKVYLAINDSGAIINLMSGWSFYYQDTCPTITESYAKWYSPKDNLWRSTTNAGTFWLVEYFCLVGEYFGDTSAITSFTPYKPTHFLLQNDLSKIFYACTPDYSGSKISMPTTTNVWTKISNDGYLLIKLSTTATPSFLSTDLGKSSNYISYATQVNASDRGAHQLFPVRANNFYRLRPTGATIDEVKLLPFKGE